MANRSRNERLAERYNRLPEKNYCRVYHYNSFTDSPFAQFKKNNVADFLDKGFTQAGCLINISEAKVRSRLQCM